MKKEKPDAKDFVVRKRGGEHIFVDRQILRWRRHRYPKSEAYAKYVDGKETRQQRFHRRKAETESLKRALEASLTHDQPPVEATLATKLPNLFSEEN